MHPVFSLVTPRVSVFAQKHKLSKVAIFVPLQWCAQFYEC